MNTAPIQANRIRVYRIARPTRGPNPLRQVQRFLRRRRALWGFPTV
jgi:hypothetical protein